MPPNKSKRHKKEAPSLSSSPRHICNDSRHNSDQPCCQILTNFALQVFPSPGAEETATPTIGTGTTALASNNSNGNTISSSDEILPTLLREYLLHERVQRKKKELEVSNKKKRKKKKKKKATTATEDNQQADGEGSTTMTSSALVEAVEEDAKAPATTEMESATETQQENGVVIVPTTAMTKSGHNGIIDNDNTASTTTNKQAQRQAERQRRIQVLLDRFLDPRVEIGARGSSTSTTDDPLQPLHSYIQSLTDDDDGLSSSNNNHNKYGKEQSSSSFSFIPAAQVEQAVRALQCPSCRRDVERLLLSAPPARQQFHEPPLRLTGVDVPTVHDPCYRPDEEELEDQALQYQLLMEEGTQPPEHAEHWTLERICGVGGGGEDDGDGNGSSQHLQGWKLRRPLASRTPVNGGGGGEHAASENHTDKNNHWSMEELDFLLQQYVVLQGLDPDIITGAAAPQQSTASTVTDNVVKSISDSVQSKTNAVVTDFAVMAKRFQKSIENFQTTSEDSNASNSNASNLNWRNFPIQNDADEECDVILNELLRIILDVTRSVQFLLTHIGGGVDVAVVDGENNHNNGGGGESQGATAFAEARRKPMSREDALTESHWATTQCIDLWKLYLDAAHRIFQSMDKYEEKLLSLKQGPNNKIPEMFISSQARLLYYTYVNAKIKSVYTLIAKIEKRLQHPTDIGMWTSKSDTTNKKTTFLRRVLLEEAYYQFVSGEEKRPHLRKPAVDAACEDVVTTVREQTTTVHAPSVDKVLEEHQNRDEKLTRLLRNAGKHLDAMIQSGGEDVGVLKGMLQGIQAVNSTSQSAKELPTMEAKRDYLKMRRSSLGPGLMEVLEHWVTYRLYHSIAEHEKRIPPTMPYHLRKAMIPGTFPCHGGNERSRAACILVGLFFQRLSEGFKEWQALIAERELLTTVEVDESLAAAAQPTASKSSKKSKKKKAKKVTTVEVETDGQLERVVFDGSVGVNKNEDEGVAAAPLGDSVVEKSAESVVASVDDATQVSSSSSSHGGTTAGAASVPVEQLRSSSDEECAPNKATEKKDPELAEAPRTEKKLHMSLDDDGGGMRNEEESMLLLSELYASSVKCGVHSKSGFETAESFLVGRLSALLESGDESLVIV